MQERIDQLCTAIEVLDTKMSLLHEMNELKHRELHKDLTEIKLELKKTLHEHEYRLDKLNSTIGAAKGSMAVITFLIGTFAVYLMKVLGV